MTEASGYSLDLYCDQKENHDMMSYSGFPSNYFSEKRSVCVREAQDAGWIFHRDLTHTCPKCSGKKRITSRPVPRVTDGMTGTFIPGVEHSVKIQDIKLNDKLRFGTIEC